MLPPTQLHKGEIHHFALDGLYQSLNETWRMHNVHSAQYTHM